MNAYGDVNPESAEGRLVAQMGDFLQVLQASYAQALVDASENYRAAEGQKNTTREGGSVLEQARDNKKYRATNSSPLSRRSVKQRSAGSTHPIMSSTAAAGILGITNLAELNNDVKQAISIRDPAAVAAEAKFLSGETGAAPKVWFSYKRWGSTSVLPQYSYSNAAFLAFSSSRVRLLSSKR